MDRLPCCDRATRRSEVAVFLSLGLAGAMMVAMAGAQMTKFVAGSDRIAASLAARQSPAAARSVVANNPQRPIPNAHASVAGWTGSAGHEAQRLAVTARLPIWR